MGIRMNEARLEELKKILNERHQNLEQGLQEDFNAQNSDASKSVSSNLNASNLDASDLNNTNSNDKNSGGLNLNAECGRKFQNLDSSGATLFKNSKTRDYDKEPLVIKDYITIVYIITIAVLLCFAMFINLVFNIPYDRKVANILLTVPLVARVLKGFSQHYGRKFIFLNSSIKCIKSGEQLVMKFDEILYFKKTFHFFMKAKHINIRKRKESQEKPVLLYTYSLIFMVRYLMTL